MSFKFSEQEELHNEIIDRSLADLYSRHLEKAADYCPGARGCGQNPAVAGQTLPCPLHAGQRNWDPT